MLSPRRSLRIAWPVLVLAAAGCGGSAAPTSPAAASPAATPSPAGSQASAARSQEGVSQGDEAVPLGKLPSDVKPLASTVELTVVPTRDGVTGVTQIRAELTKPRSRIWLHGKGLKVSKATVTPAGGAPITAIWEQAHESGVVALRLPRAIGPGEVTLSLEHTAPWGADGDGLYVEKEAGVPYAYTQFEAIDARTAFPCFDEPRFKIPFTVVLNVAKGDQAVANTKPVRREPRDGGLERIEFAATKPIPSYLVAFAVGPFDIVDAPAITPTRVRSETIPLRGVAPKGRGKEMAYSLAHTGDFVKLLEEYTGIAYPYGKLDIIAVPGKGGAMENPGAITFAENLVLFDERTAPVGQKRGYASVMAHELAHQWFGNLVTSSYWDDIWLNEAFASWLGTRTHDRWSPDSGAIAERVTSGQWVLQQEGLTRVRRIREPIQNAGDIEHAFDAVTYQKGAAVLGMFERWLGADAFQRGVHAYLTRHAYKAATAEDFLAALGEAAGKDVATPMRTFLDQPGAPLVESKVVCNEAGAALSLTQRRYVPLGSTVTANGTWSVPVCTKVETNGRIEETCTLLTGPTATVPLATKTCPAWALPNADASGYYALGLDEASIRALLKAMPRLTMGDKLAFAEAVRSGFDRGTVPATLAIDAAKVFAAEKNDDVVLAGASPVRTAHSWLEETKDEAPVAELVRATYGKPFAALGLGAKGKAVEASKEPDARRELRASLAWLLAVEGHDVALRQKLAAQGRAMLGAAGDGKLDLQASSPELRALSLRVALEDGNAATFDAALEDFAKVSGDQERWLLLRGLGNVTEPTLSSRARALALDPRLRDSEVTFPLFAQMGHVGTREATWAWLREHYDQVVARIPEGSRFQLARLGAGFCSFAKEEEVRAFFTPRVSEEDGSARALSQSLETIHQCAARRVAQEPAVRASFQARAR